MRKTILVLSTFLLLITVGPVSYAQASTTSSTTTDLSTTNKSNIRFGLQIGWLIFSARLGAWYEHSWSEVWGTRVAVLYDELSTKSPDKDILKGNPLARFGSQYITLPILLTSRLDPERSSCLFGGMQLGYLLKTKGLPAAVDKNQIVKFKMGLVAGFDYEFSFGLTLGLSGVKYLIDIVEKGTLYDNWRLHPSWYIYPTVGYNIAALF